MVRKGERFKKQNRRDSDEQKNNFYFRKTNELKACAFNCLVSETALSQLM